MSLTRSAIMLAAIYGVLVLAFTGIGMAVAAPGAQVGGTRSLGTIPGHLLELAFFGLLLGAASAVFYGRKGLPLFLLTPFLVVLLDLDHIPAYLGLSQPIRPAHSFVFLLFALVSAAIVLRRIDLELILTSSFMAHLGVDSGLFPPFSPLSFEYIQVDPYRVPLLVGSVTFALLAGLFWRNRVKGKSAR
ncbi:MAG: hypothetical protein OK438_00885 [Thaumarchaeota archaeon]|nr:hypothetical protein [Nitrososphaerota archaeon]